MRYEFAIIINLPIFKRNYYYLMTVPLEEEQRRKNRRLLILYMIGLLIAGAAILIVYKFQNKTSYYEPGNPGADKNGNVYWNHPFF
jgi:CHASE1-domain containing sensor protein